MSSLCALAPAILAIGSTALRADHATLAERLAPLVQQLDLAAHLGDARELCVTAIGTHNDEALRGVLASVLAAAGFPGGASCPDGARDANDEALDDAAQIDGFEWRVVVRPDDEGLSLELRAVDRGLWAPRDLPRVVAWAREPPPVEVGPEITPVPTPNPPEPGLRLVRVFGLDRPARALAACDLTNDGVPELLTLTDDRLLVWRERRGSYVVVGEWDIRDLPRASVRVRDPIGGCVCAPMGPGGAMRVAIGHSDLERGVLLAPRSEGAGLRLERERSIPSIPLAWVSGALVSGAPDQGRNRVGPTLFVGDHAIELARPILELAAPPPGIRARAIALDGEHRVIGLSDALALGPAIASSGAGITQVPMSAGASVIAISSRLRGTSDTVRLVDPITGATAFGPIGVGGSIVTTASARPAELWIAAHVSDGDRTAIYRLSIMEAPR